MQKPMTNKEYSETNQELIKACEKVNIPATTRQASKWRRKKGKAWKDGRPWKN